MVENISQTVKSHVTIAETSLPFRPALSRTAGQAGLCGIILHKCIIESYCPKSDPCSLTTSLLNTFGEFISVNTYLPFCKGRLYQHANLRYPLVI